MGMPKAIDSAKPPSVAYVVTRLSLRSRGHSATSCLTTASGAGIRYGGMRKMSITARCRQAARRRMAAAPERKPGDDIRDAGRLRAVDRLRHPHRRLDRLLAHRRK